MLLSFIFSAIRNRDILLVEISSEGIVIVSKWGLIIRMVSTFLAPYFPWQVYLMYTIMRWLYLYVLLDGFHVLTYCLLKPRWSLHNYDTKNWLDGIIVYLVRHLTMTSLWDLIISIILSNTNVQLEFAFMLFVRTKLFYSNGHFSTITITSHQPSTRFQQCKQMASREIRLYN